MYIPVPKSNLKGIDFTHITPRDWKVLDINNRTLSPAYVERVLRRLLGARMLTPQGAYVRISNVRVEWTREDIWKERIAEEKEMQKKEIHGEDGLG